MSAECVVYFGRDLIREISSIVVTGNTNTNFHSRYIQDRATCIVVRQSDRVVTGYNDDDGSWYRRTPPWSSFPFFDARTQMSELRAFLGLPPAQSHSMNAIIKHGNNEEIIRKLKELVPGLYTDGADAVRIRDGRQAPGGTGTYSRYRTQTENWEGYQFIDATTNWDQVLALFGMGERVFMTNCIIKTNDDLAQSKAVIRLAIAAGYNKLYEGAFSSVVCGDWHPGGGLKQLLQGNYDTNILAKPDWPRLDAATDMGKIKLFFEGKLELPFTIERFVQPKLLELIRNNPSDDLVVGFIRRDLKLALPKDIQDGGADAICGWILDKKKAEQPTVPVGAHAPKTNKFKISFDFTVSGSTSWYRNDRVDFEGVVPQTVIDDAVAQGDYEIIENWLIEHRSELREINRREGDEQDHHSEDNDSSFEGLTELDYANHSVEDQFNELTGN